ncbi:unnamed protein product [Adineta steineri]|uniref:Diacetyl reductase [(S)-acetoin forming] n=1 Tax=Adineta steineri TaxID=433720 RepID=A0A816CYJ9_9BILA|nr:unnamed protein product [Adineta steineri]CAF1626287.1 unnamed protein product [Adineta steineri]
MTRIALVTGAARGMGRAIALRLARDGLNVAVNDINENSVGLHDTRKEIEKFGRKSLAIIADVANEKEVEIMIKNTAKELGSLNVMVANAGICPVKPLIELSADDWDKVMGVNLRGVFLCYKEAAKVMIAQGNGGKIIGACSVAGYMAAPLATHYCASKWGVRGLTQSAAVELAPYKITVNAYCPGVVDTQMVNSCSEQFAAHNKVSKEDIYNSFLQKIPLGRLAKPDDIANFVSYLASENSNYITGQSIIVDGGFSLS